MKSIHEARMNKVARVSFCARVSDRQIFGAGFTSRSTSKVAVAAQDLTSKQARKEIIAHRSPMISMC